MLQDLSYRSLIDDLGVFGGRSVADPGDFAGGTKREREGLRESFGEIEEGVFR